jgi:hypothetical protein
MSIEFKDMGMPVFTGRKRGKLAREALNLSQLDVAREKVTVRIPEETYTVSNSYFLGLFGPSVRSLGGREGFLEHYHFSGPERVLGKLDDWIEDAMRRSDELI